MNITELNITEILAVTFVALFFLKTAMMMWGQKRYYRIKKAVLEYRKTFTVLSVILLVVAGYYAFQELTPVQVAAASIVVVLWECVALFTHSHFDELKELKKKITMSRNLAKRNWFSLTLLAIFAVWVVIKIAV